MADPSTPKKSWTDAEKAQLFASIIKTHAPKIDWAKVERPPGRTVKACTHVIQHLKEDAGMVTPKKPTNHHLAPDQDDTPTAKGKKTGGNTKRSRDDDEESSDKPKKLKKEPEAV